LASVEEVDDEDVEMDEEEEDDVNEGQVDDDLVNEVGEEAYVSAAVVEGPDLELVRAEGDVKEI
jgi:hypothetical protein